MNLQYITDIHMRIEKTIDRGSKEKLYVQMYEIFLEKIISGEWHDGIKIPPEDELCRMYDVSKITVREAIQELVREGYLIRQQGKGTFVTFSFPQSGRVMRTRVSEDDIHGEEVMVEKELLERGLKGFTENIRTLLRTEEEIYYILSKKIVGNEMYIEECFLPLFVCPDIETEDLSNRSLYDLIEEKGTKKISKIMQTIEVTRINQETASILGVQERTPAPLISRTLFSSDGSPIAHFRIIGGGMKCKFKREFERIK